MGKGYWRLCWTSVAASTAGSFALDVACCWRLLVVCGLPYLQRRVVGVVAFLLNRWRSVHAAHRAYGKLVFPISKSRI